MRVVKVSNEFYEYVVSQKSGVETFAEVTTRIFLRPTEPKKTKTKPKKESKNTVTVDLTENEPSLGALFREEYKNVFKYEYPAWGAKENTQMRNWAKSLTREQAEWCIRAFMRWNNPRAVKSGHSLSVLVTSHIELVSDHQRPLEKQKQLRAAKRHEEDLSFYAGIESRGTRDSLSGERGLSEIPSKPKARVSRELSELPESSIQPTGCESDTKTSN